MLSCAFSWEGAVVQNSVTTSTIWGQGTSLDPSLLCTITANVNIVKKQITVHVTMRIVLTLWTPYFRKLEGSTDHTLKN